MAQFYILHEIINTSNQSARFGCSLRLAMIITHINLRRRVGTKWFAVRHFCVDPQAFDNKIIKLINHLNIVPVLIKFDVENQVSIDFFLSIQPTVCQVN